MTTEVDERPLLQDVDLMTTMLRVAEAGEATVAACVARLAGHLAQAREPPPLSEPELAARFAALGRKLAIARLIEPAAGEAFRLTPRGRQALAAHPTGVDESVLAGFPEFRAFLLRRSRTGTEHKGMAAVYDQGFAAYGLGLTHTANPHPPDSAAHLDWENGWFEARDEDR